MAGKPRIVVLDGYALNPGDLDWAPLKALGECEIYDRTPVERILERSSGAEILLTNKTPIDRDTILSLPGLRYIGVLATGYNVVDVSTARARDIAVCNVPGYGTPSVVQLTFALILEMTHRVQRHSDSVMAGRWASSADWSYWEHPLIELEGKMLGIIGLGNIGARVASVAQAFGMRVQALARENMVQAPPAASWVERVGLDELLSTSDIVTIHCPLTPQTKGLITSDRLSRMRSSAFLINTSRGPIVHESDLAEALEAGTIAGAGLDVLSQEPPDASNPLFRARNCIITPHIAWATREARSRLLWETVDNLRSWQEGRPRNVVNR
jgi:glycerate dehydrogenase